MRRIALGMLAVVALLAGPGDTLGNSRGASGHPDPALGPHLADEARHTRDVLHFTKATTSAIARATRPATATLAGSAMALSNASLTREVLGFAPYWALTDTNVQVNWKYNLLSTVAYFGLTVNSDGSFNTSDGGWGGWTSQQLIDMISRAHAAGDRVVVVIKATSSATANQIVTDPTGKAQSNAIANTISALTDPAKNLDGVNVDFEGIANGDLTIQHGFTNFMQQLSTRVRQARANAFLSVDTYGGSASGNDGFFKIDDLAPLVDAMFIMAYDASFSNAPGHAGPTAPLNGWTYNDTLDVQQYLTKAPAAKLILGVPYYGYKWCTIDDTPYSQARTCANSSGAAADGYATVLQDLSCGAQQLRVRWDVTAASPWASWWSPATGDPCGGNHGSWRELYYDDANSLGLKYDLVNSNNLRGTGMWALGYDGTSNDLWNELSLKFVSTWESLGGNLTSGPDASTQGSGRLDVFVRGSDNALYHKTFDGTNWSGWERLGGVLTADPSAVSWGSGRIDVFVRGSDSALYRKSFDRTGWSVWERLGGVLTSSPDAASWGPNRLDVFARGSDNALYHKWFDGTGWSGWDRVGGAVTADPSAVSSSPNRIDVFVRSTDNGLWRKSFDGTTWSEWEGLGGKLTSGPDAASWGPNRLDVVVRSSDNGLYHKWFDGTSWSGWQAVGGKLTADPSAVSPGSGRVDLFVRGVDNALWHKTLYILP